MTFVLSSARDDTIAPLLIFEEQEADVSPDDDILVLEWGIHCFPVHCPARSLAGCAIYLG